MRWSSRGKERELTREMQSHCQAAFKGSAEARKRDFMRTVSAVDCFPPAAFRCVGVGSLQAKFG